MNVTIFKNIKDTSAGYHRDIHFIFDRIRNGSSKDLVEKIRKEKNPEKHRLLKNSLPSICFSGTFSNRSDDGIISHSGFICLDFDKFPDNQALNDNLSNIIKDKFTYAAFISPSGNGIKVLVKIPPVKEDHKSYFEALKDYYDSQYFDIACSNISRVCYESYDPNLFLNESSDLWDIKEDNPHFNIGDTTHILPLKNESRIIQNLLIWFDKNIGFSKGSRNNSLFKLAMAFNDFGVNKFETEVTLKRFITADFTEREIESVINSAYKNTTSHGTKFFEDKDLRGKIERQIKSGKSRKEIRKSLSNYSDEEIDDAINGIQENSTVSEFWNVSANGKPYLVPHKYKEFLQQNNFYKLYPNDAENFIFIQIKGGFIENCDPIIMKDFVLNYLYTHKSGILPYDYMASSTKFFKEDYLNFLKTEQVNFKEDTQDTCYLYFNNKALKITKDNFEQIDYLNLEGFVWRKHIIERDFTKLDTLDDTCQFKHFIWLISGQNPERENSLISVIGYLLHSYKTSANNKAIILNDEVISENPNGGSGKGLFCQALSHIKRVSTLDGKQFDFTKSFPYQTVGADTQLLVFDDVKKNFTFENLFSLVTEGITLEKKNKDAIHLKVNKSPKIIITTNYTIGGVGGSHERRKFEIEFSAHFNDRHSPYDEYGQMMFEDWNKEEWVKFDNFMVYCVQFYLKNGLVSHKYQNLHLRKFIRETSYEFNEWADDDNLAINSRLDKSALFNNFVGEYPDYKKWLTQKKFSLWLDSFGKFKGYKLNKGKSNGFRWIEYIDGTGNTEQPF